MKMNAIKIHDKKGVRGIEVIVTKHPSTYTDDLFLSYTCVERGQQTSAFSETSGASSTATHISVASRIYHADVSQGSGPAASERT